MVFWVVFWLWIRSKKGCCSYSGYICKIWWNFNLLTVASWYHRQWGVSNQTRLRQYIWGEKVINTSEPRARFSTQLFPSACLDMGETEHWNTQCFYMWFIEITIAICNQGWILVVWGNVMKNFLNLYCDRHTTVELFPHLMHRLLSILMTHLFIMLTQYWPFHWIKIARGGKHPLCYRSRSTFILQ